MIIVEYWIKLGMWLKHLFDYSFFPCPLNFASDYGFGLYPDPSWVTAYDSEAYDQNERGNFVVIQDRTKTKKINPTYV